jgi:amino acid adenylation domain-containing protein/thioester reductase-like protein
MRAASVARRLKADWKVEPGDRIGLIMTGGLEVVPAILGAWMAGAAYVPVDPYLPDERLFQIASDADLKGILSQHAHCITLGLLSTRLGKPVPVLEVDRMEFTASADVPVELAVPSERPAYIIYTSGSTGRPKGVVCTFGGLENLVAAVREPLGLSATTRHLQFASLSFDASVWDIFPTLFAGGTVVHASHDELLPGKRMARAVRDARITHLCLPPSVLGKLSAFAGTLRDLECIVMAGERCPPPLAEHWSKTCRVINAYGPTETTVCASMYEVKGGESPVPIGRELSGMRLRVVDADGNDCAAETRGELWIGGLGLAAGYRGQDELTAQKFPRDASGETWYRSGDEVFRRADGELVFTGRLDLQVKLRGFRIELEAIEGALYAFPHIAQAAVKVFEETDDEGTSSGILAAYYSVAEGHAIDRESLRAHLAARLADYMVPHHFVELRHLPLMPNGSKVDRSALEAPAEWTRARARHSEFDAPATPLHKVRRCFARALRQSTSGVAADTHFFRAGGDSLGVARLLALFEEAFGVALPPRLVYSKPTPAELLPYCLQEREASLDTNRARAELLADAAWKAPSLADKPRAEGLPKRILLTGGTGFLGIHLVAALAPRAQRLYCLVRARDEAEAHARLQETAKRYGVDVAWSDRIVPVVGDITSETLGLSPERYQEVAHEADAIVHSAANISYILPYSEAGKPNATGARNVLAMATAGKIKAVHHVSSMSVYGATGSLLGLPVVDETFDIDASLDLVSFENGYTRAKWVAEKMISKAKQAGVPVSIYRPGFIEGDSRTGIGNPDDLFGRLLVGNVQMGIYPDFPNKYWFSVPVDYVAGAMAHLVCTQEPGGTYILLPARGQEPSNNGIFSLIGEAMGFPMKRVQPHEWFAELARIGPDNALFPLVNYLREKLYLGRRTVLEVHHRSSVVDTDRTLAALEGSGMHCPDFDASLVTKYMEHLFTKYARPTHEAPRSRRNLGRHQTVRQRGNSVGLDIPG